MHKLLKKLFLGIVVLFVFLFFSQHSANASSHLCSNYTEAQTQKLQSLHLSIISGTTEIDKQVIADLNQLESLKKNEDDLNISFATIRGNVDTLMEQFQSLKPALK